MNSIALLDGGATLFLLAAMIYLLLNHKRLPDSRRLKTTLFLSLATFAFMTAFNFLEHSGITDKPDTLEDLSEIIFFFLFIFFIYSYKTNRDMNELRVREDWLNSALESLIQGVIIVDGENRILRINQKLPR